VPDTDFYSFTVQPTGSAIQEVRVNVAYGCSFTGGGMLQASQPSVRLEDSNGNALGTFQGQQTYTAVDGSGLYGYGGANFQFPSAATPQDLNVVLDDGFGFNWCMDFALYVELVQ